MGLGEDGWRRIFYGGIWVHRMRGVFGGQGVINGFFSEEENAKPINDDFFIFPLAQLSHTQDFFSYLWFSGD